MPQIPASMNLPDNLVAVPSQMFNEPREGRKSITQLIDWAIPLAANKSAIFTNLQNNATLEFSQICGLIVDNSECGADLDFIFPDTEVTISIPAYAPFTVLDVPTNQTQFYVVANGAIAGDKTRYSILNYAPPPVAVPVTQQQNIAKLANQALDGATTVALLAAGTNGTLEALNVNVACPLPSVSFNDRLALADGTGKIIWAGNVAAQNTSTGFTVSLCDLVGLHVRFENGLNIIQAGGFAPGATFNVNAYYRTP